jgi:hypothetical protein
MLKDSLPAPPIQVQPLGLLDFFQLKNGGEYPQTLGDVLSPTWDLRDHYLQTNAVISELTTIALATGDNQWVQFFAGSPSWRWFNWMQWNVTPLNAADTMQGWPAIRFPNAGQPAVVPWIGQGTSGGNSMWFQAASAVLRTVYGSTLGGFWVPPNFEVGFIQFAAVSTGGLATMRRSASVVTFRS